MANVIEFERFKDVTGWPIYQIREYARERNWGGLRIHLPKKDDDPVLIERLPENSA